MSRLVGLIMCLAVMSSAFAAPVGFSQQSPSLLFTGSEHFVPFSSRKQDTLSGISIHLTERLCHELHLSCELRVYAANDNTLKLLRNGDIDVIVAIDRNQLDAKKDSFTLSYASSPIMVFSRRAQGVSFQRWADLLGKRGAKAVALSLNASFEHYAKARLNIVNAPTRRVALQRLARGEVDYVIAPLYATLIDIRQLGLRQVLARSPQSIEAHHLVMALSSRSKYRIMRQALNDRLRTSVIQSYISQAVADFMQHDDVALISSRG